MVALPGGDEAEQHRRRAGEVAGEMERVRLERRAPVAAAGAEGDVRAAGVDDHHDPDHQQRPAARVDLALGQPEQAPQRAPGDQEARDDEDRRLARARRGARPCRARRRGPDRPGRTATPSATKVRIAATRSVPEWAASESRPRLCVAIPATSLTAISTHAARIETRAVRRWGLTTRRIAHNAKGPPERALRWRCVRAALRVRDVAAEAFLQERPGAVALVEPVAVLEPLVPQAACTRSRTCRPSSSRSTRRSRSSRRRSSIQTSVNPQSAGQVAFGLNVPPVTLPCR